MNKIIVFILLSTSIILAQAKRDVGQKRLEYIPGELIIKYKAIGSEPRGNQIYDEYDSFVVKLKNKIDSITIERYNPIFDSIVKNMIIQNATEREVIHSLNSIRLNKTGYAYSTENNEFSKILRLRYNSKNLTAIDVTNKIQSQAYKLEQEGFQIVYVEPVYLRYINLDGGDPLYSQQWSYTASNMEKAWKITEGSPDVIISIIDMGVDATHPDLIDNLLTNGYDFVDIDTASYLQQNFKLIGNEDYTTEDSICTDYNGHGTHCAGIAAAKGNNGIGIKGVAPLCKLLPIRAGFSIINPDGEEVGLLETTSIAKSIRFAVDNNAAIISMSFGGSYSELEKEAIEYAYAHNVVLIAAAGNSNTSQKTYPAGYDQVLSVTSINRSLLKSSFSNYGYWTDLAAPGEDIISTVPFTGGKNTDTSGYKILSGTSQAAPFIAGVAALYVSKNKNKKNREVYQALKAGTVPYLFADYYIGTGVVDVYKTINEEDPCIASITYPIPCDSLILLENKEFSVSGKAYGKYFSSYYFEISASLKDSSSWIMIGNYYTSVIDSGLLGRMQIPQDGVFYLRLNVKSSAGKHYTDIIGPITADKRLKEHWPVNTQSEIVSSPVISDVDGDGKNEIVINSSNGRVYMLDRDGKNKPGWPVALDSNSYHDGGIFSAAVVGYCSPAVGDINNDGKEEIAVRDGQYLYVYDYWGKPLPGWPVQLGWFFIGNGQVGSPVIADIDQDGFKDILVTHLDGYIYVFDKDGKPVQGWPQKILDYAFATSFCTPVVSDINGDGKPEIIVQTLNESSRQGSIYVYNNHGELLPGWPQIIGTGGYTSPIAVDLYNDGLNEIIACSHIAVENSVYGKLGIYAFNKDGQLLNGWPVALEYNGFGYYDVTAGLSAGDINNDGKIEIVVSSYGYIYSLWMLDAKGQILWKLNSKIFEYVQSSAPLIADINNDGKPEIIFAKVQNIPETFGRIIVVDNKGRINENLSRVIPEQIRGTPSIGDVDGDNKLEIVAGAQNGNIYCWGFDGTADPHNLIWPTFQGNKNRTGTATFTGLPTNTSVLKPEIPKEYYLSNNYPNPFNPLTRFQYSLPEPSQVNLEVYNVIGQKVETILNCPMESGNYIFEWDGGKYSSGVYFMKFIANGKKNNRSMVFNRKMLLLK